MNSQRGTAVRRSSADSQGAICAHLAMGARASGYDV